MLDLNDMGPELYASPWFLTLHVSRTKDVSVILYLWDRLIVELSHDPLLHYFLSLALLLSKRDELIAEQSVCTSLFAFALYGLVTLLFFHSFRPIHSVYPLFHFCLDSHRLYLLQTLLPSFSPFLSLSLLFLLLYHLMVPYFAPSLTTCITYYFPTLTQVMLPEKLTRLSLTSIPQVDALIKKAKSLRECTPASFSFQLHMLTTRKISVDSIEYRRLLKAPCVAVSAAEVFAHVSQRPPELIASPTAGSSPSASSSPSNTSASGTPPTSNGQATVQYFILDCRTQRVCCY